MTQGRLSPERPRFHPWPAAGANSRAKPSEAAEPVVAAILPIAAEVLVGDVHRDHVLGILESELGRHADLHRETVAARKGLVGKPECDLGVRWHCGRHVDAGAM